MERIKLYQDGKDILMKEINEAVNLIGPHRKGMNQKHPGEPNVTGQKKINMLSQPSSSRTGKTQTQWS